ncbi:MAG: hypothetical protein JKY00_01705 [Roseicyclus sp.]|nr:hypothetical protein [Roseicyclus sp.]
MSIPAPVDDALARIAWAASSMPVLEHALAGLCSVDGVAITLALPVEPKLAALALRLHAVGAEVAVLGRATSTDATLSEVALTEAALSEATLFEALRQAGVSVHTRLEECASGYILGATAEMLPGQKGATMQGQPPVEPPGEPPVPVIDLSGSALLALAEDHIGIGQASVMAFLDITNLQLAGRRVVVCGYDGAGQSVAAHVAAFGGRVTVVETDPLRAAQALMAGFSVAAFATVLPRAEVVFVTSNGPILGARQAPYLADGTLLCAAGPDAAISADLLACARNRRDIRAFVTEFDLPNAQAVKVIAQGRPVHLAEGQGLPIEASDIVLALHIKGLDQLLRGGLVAGGPHGLAPEAEAELAGVKVIAMGARLEAKG